MNNGTTSKLSNTPPLRNPTVNATPIAPMQLKMGVPTSKVTTNAHQIFTSNESNNAAIGESKINGKPVNSQCATTFASAVSAKG